MSHSTTRATFLITSTGNLGVASGGSLTAGSGYKITLADAGAFTNGAGAGALNVSGGGRWLVYSQNPGADLDTGLTPDFKQYNATYGTTPPAQGGNGILFTLAPVVTVSPTGTVSKVYDGSTAATVASGNLVNSGAGRGRHRLSFCRLGGPIPTPMSATVLVLLYRALASRPLTAAFRCTAIRSRAFPPISAA